MSKNKYMCPVCGFKGLKEEPYNRQNLPSHEICPCCGFEFGFDDVASQDAFSQNWIKNGANWFMPKLKPINWNLNEQLSNLVKKN